MNRQTMPFALHNLTSPNLCRVHDYWVSLKRGGNDIPFSDDLRLPALPDLASALLLLDVFALPQRFRLNIVGELWGGENGSDVVGRFLDEIPPAPHFEFLQSQCAATIESGKPTWYGPRAGSHGASKTPVYERLLLPMWCDGRINMILGAIDRHRAQSIER